MKWNLLTEQEIVDRAALRRWRRFRFRLLAIAFLLALGALLGFLAVVLRPKPDRACKQADSGCYQGF